MRHKVRVDHEPTRQPPGNVGSFAVICGGLYVLVPSRGDWTKYMWWGLESSNHWAEPDTLHRALAQVGQAVADFPGQDSRILAAGTRLTIHVGEGQ